jgi:arylsulfatase A-like enzyme
MIENIDDNLGLLMEKLDAWGIEDNMILTFMSDYGKTLAGGRNTVHGETYNAGMRGFKTSPYEGGTRVPFFIRWPGKFKARREVDHLLNHYDILPTLAALANIDITDLNVNGSGLPDVFESNTDTNQVHIYSNRDKIWGIRIGD